MSVKSLAKAFAENAKDFVTYPFRYVDDAFKEHMEYGGKDLRSEINRHLDENKNLTFSAQGLVMTNLTFAFAAMGALHSAFEVGIPQAAFAGYMLGMYAMPRFGITPLTKMMGVEDKAGQTKIFPKLAKSSTPSKPVV